MAKRGPIPSLIGATHGSVTFHIAGRKMECRRCNAKVLKGTECVQVTKPGTMGRGRAYCTDCFADVLDQTQHKLNELREQLLSCAS